MYLANKNSKKLICGDYWGFGLVDELVKTLIDCPDYAAPKRGLTVKDFFDERFCNWSAVFIR